MKKPTVCVLFGGKSDEYEVSLKSAYAVLSNIDNKKYDIVKIGITKSGEWYLFLGDISLILNDTWWQSDALCPVTIDTSLGKIVVFDRNTYSLDIDTVFPIIHGAFGEDGRLQGLLEMAGIKFVGCPSFSSFACMDKYLTKLVCDSVGVPNAKSVVINKYDLVYFEKVAEKIRKIGYPVFIKPARGGSSVGVSKISKESELYGAVSKALYHSERVIVEEFICGKETEIALIQDGGTLKLSTAGNLIYKSEFYDYDTKYNSDEVDYIIPAEISEKSYEKIKEYSKILFYALECKGLCRMDFFVKDDGSVIFNEVNTMPGFTDISMFPALLIHDGYTFSSIIDALLRESL